MDPQTPAPVRDLTFLEIALANVAAAAASEVNLLNDNLKTNYLTGFNNWASAVLAGKIPNSDPPAPPAGYAYTKDADGWAYVIRGTDPVCAMPAIPDQPKTWTPPPMPEPDNVRNVPAGDNLPVGYVLTASDGTRWQKQGTPTPFGVAYYYAKIS